MPPEIIMRMAKPTANNTNFFLFILRSRISLKAQSAKIKYHYALNLPKKKYVFYSTKGSGENVASVIENLKKKLGTDEFCLDAEGKLREKRSSAYHDDDLDSEKVSE